MDYYQTLSISERLSLLATRRLNIAQRALLLTKAVKAGEKTAEAASREYDVLAAERKAINCELRYHSCTKPPAWYIPAKPG